MLKSRAEKKDNSRVYLLFTTLWHRSRGDNVDTKPSVPRPEHQTIILPEDYDPLASLTQLETLYTFSSKALHGMPSVDEKVSMIRPCD